jgi:V8-like Glu-specific endopeptidase
MLIFRESTIKCTLLVSLFFLSISFCASASLGIKVQLETIPQGLCRVTLHHNLTGDDFHCTGSVIGKNTIKTAGHCLNNSSVKKIECIGAKKATYYSHETYPSYDQQSLESAIENRFQDQALITVIEDLSSISFTALTNSSSLDLNSFSECLIAGFGLQEKSLNKTGYLSGSLIPDHAKRIKLSSGIINVKGAYLVELLPGDSGGQLLCYRNSSWFDLGTASAHSWEHESIYAANSNLGFSSSPLFKEIQRIRKPTLQLNRVSAKKPRYLAPYSTVKTVDGEFLYNGDLDFVMISDVSPIDANFIKATLKVESASINFLCLGQFLCYGDVKEVIINKRDILDTRYRYPPLYDPFL